MATPLSSLPVKKLQGTLRIPGDKSISHRAVMLASLAEGTSQIFNPLISEDIHATINAFSAMGAAISTDKSQLTVTGVGKKGLQEPHDVLFMGNSGTSTRLIMGIVGGYPMSTFLSGDPSLSKRPMNRVIAPLSSMGISFFARQNNYLPLLIKGAENLSPLVHTLSVASAQVKTAILFAAMHASGTSVITEPIPTRDHTETMLPAFGCPVSKERTKNTTQISLNGHPSLQAIDIHVPSDFSAAAFPLVAALVTQDSSLTLPQVNTNPTRTGLLQCLIEMGANISLTNPSLQGGEPVADIHAESSELKAIKVPLERVPLMIDEFPILAVAAACATGTTVCQGLSELRVKESDRLTATADMLIAAGVKVETSHDSISIHGNGKSPSGGGFVQTHLDHRIAMSALVLGMAAANPMTIDNPLAIHSSFPSFSSLMTSIGASFSTSSHENS
jgi:3-phosphoshikimate 1-carboxyvinyltransferase